MTSMNVLLLDVDTPEVDAPKKRESVTVAVTKPAVVAKSMPFAPCENTVVCNEQFPLPPSATLMPLPVLSVDIAIVDRQFRPCMKLMPLTPVPSPVDRGDCE